MQEPLKALTQSYSRTKARNYQEFKNSMELHTNSSNNTIYADADGTIAYFHSNFIPKRDAKFDWTKPVDGSDPATEWHELMSIDESPGLKNPKSGWLYNSNNWPWSAAGPDSLKRDAISRPTSIAAPKRARAGMHALKVFPGKKDFTLDSLLAAAYDSYLPWFAEEIPPLVKAWDAAPAGRAQEQGRGSDRAAEIVGLPLGGGLGADRRSRCTGARKWAARGNRDAPSRQLQALAAASDRLARDFGTWKTPWGEINRFQRLTGDIVQPFNDAGPSIPVGFTSARWGSLASFGARTLSGTKKMVRHQRQQLRRRRRIRRPGQGAGGDRRRRERRPVVEALQRSGAALRHRQPARGLLLRRAAQGTHGARVSSRALTAADETVEGHR